MKTFAKRSLAMALALLLCISLLSGLSFAEAATKATTSYSTSSNSGVRGEVCTALPSSALNYYTGSYAYDTLSTQSSSSILSALRTLTTQTHKKSTSYENCKDYADQTDCQRNDGTVTLIYTGYQAKASQFSGSSPGWNREHVWPQNLGDFGTSGPGSDLHHIRPSDVKTNSDRSNKRYGNVSGGTASTALITGAVGMLGGYYDTYFEPLDEVKGDVARICLYMHVRYGGNSSYNCGSITTVFESTATLLEWMEIDPVDTWEMGRNEVVQNIQGNRNPLIDYPEYAWLLFGKDVPAGYTSPSGGSGTSYSITAVSNNTSYGTVSLSGRTITATPRTGYYAAGYTVTSGSATVTQEGNVFTVNAASNCTVRINFAAKTSVTVSFYENGTKASTLTGYAGESVALPAHKNTVPTGYSFVGWLGSQLSETTAKPSYLAPGSSYTPSGNVSFYAVYTKVVGGNGSTGEYRLFTGALTEGDYVIVYDGAAMVAADGNANTRLDFATVTITNNCITQPDDGIVWHIAPTGDGYYTIYNTAAALYAGGNGTKNQATLLDSVTDYAKWTAAAGSSSVTFEFINLGNANKGVNANLRKNGTTGYGCYSTGTGNSLSLYHGESGTVYYTTSAATCNHNWIASSVVRPTCTEGGYTTYTCSRCGATKQENATNPKGHSYSTWISDKNGNHYKTCSSCGDKVTESCTYNSVVTAPTETVAGYTTHTCTTCKYSYKDSEVPALGAKQLISFSVPKGVTAPASQSAYVGNTITLPSLVGTPSDDSYSSIFIGWIAANVDNKTEVGTYYAAGETYTVSKSETLYALYRYAVGGSGSTEYVLTDISSIDPTDEVVITMQYGNTLYAMPNNNTSTPEAVIISASNGKLTGAIGETLLWNVGGNEGNYTFYPNGTTDSWLYCTTSNTGVRVGTNSASTFRIDASSGYLRHNGTNRYLGVYRSNPDWRCYTSSTTNIGDQTLGFYTKGASGTIYYTTVFAAAACQHSNYYVNNGDGTHDYVCKLCGIVVVDNEAHSYTNGSCICGEVEITEPVLDSSLTFGAQLYLENDLTMAFRVKTDKLNAYDISTAYLVVERDVYESGAKEATVEAMTISEYKIENGRLIFSYPGIAAAQMNDAIRATFYIKNAKGQEYVSPVLNTSVATYLDGLLGSSTSDTKMVTLIMDMLNYGAAAQIYFDRHADAPVNVAFESFKTYASYASSDFRTALENLSATENADGKSGKLNLGLDLGTRIGIQYKVTVPTDVNVEDVTLVVTDASGNVLENLAVAGNETDSRGRYLVNFYGSTSRDMRRVVYATAYANGEAITGTYAYSISTYAWGVQENASLQPAELVSVTRAMLLYGDSAANYFA